MPDFPSAHGTPNADTPSGNPPAGYIPGPVEPPAARRPSRRKTWLTHGLTALIALIIGAAIGGSGKSDSDGTAAHPANVPATSPVTSAPQSASPQATATTARPDTSASPTTQATAPAASSSALPAQQGPATSVRGEGQYLVGEEMDAGTYKTAGPADSVIPNCYWARNKDASGEFGAIIANGNVQGPTRVTVRKGEYFQTTGCQPWEKVG